MKRDDLGLRRLIAHCADGFDRPDLPVDLRELVAAVVPFDKACWGLLDPTTLWPVTSVSTGPDGGALAVRAWEYELTVPDVTSIAHLSRATSHVGVLSAETGGEPGRSPRYRDVLAPQGVSDELRCVLSVGGASWGWLALFRCDGSSFTPRDSERIATVGPHLARGWRAALLRSGAEPDGEPPAPAVIVLDAADRVESMTPNGQALLDQLPTGRAGPVADVLHALALAARLGLRPPTPNAEQASRARAMLPGSGGSWLLLEAAPLLGRDDRVAVTVGQAGRSELSGVLLRAYGLTDREIDIALSVLRNETSKQIAASLHLSPWTVQDHLKAVFAKTGVRSRRDLAMQLFSPPSHHRQSPSR